MKYFDQQPGLYRMNLGWKFYDGALEPVPEDCHGAVRGLYGKAIMEWGPTSLDFDDSAWEDVRLPHDSVVRRDFTEDSRAGAFHGGKMRGPVWYRRHFTLLEEDRDKQLLIEFEGLSRDALVFVNGTCLCRHRSGYHPLTVDITDVARFGAEENVIVVQILPEAEGWWYEGLGIYRPAWLIKKNKLHIVEDGLFVKPVRNEEGWETHMSAEVENAGDAPVSAEVRFYLYDPEGLEVADYARRVRLEAGETRKVTVVSYAASAELWSVDDPRRYRCTVELHSAGIADYRKAYYGYRTIRFDADTGFYLNNVNMKLKGFCIHQDHTGVGVAVPYAIKEYRLKLLKEIGANAIRTAHHTDPDIQDIADRLGLMVMEESRAFRADPETLGYLRQMARKARNHPSVILYSLFNEEPQQGTSVGARLVRHMRQAISQEDDTRPFTGAMNGGFLGDVSGLDVIGINYNTASYDEVHAKFPDKPIIGSETVSSFMVRGEYATDEDRHVVSDYDESCAPWGNTVRDGWRQVNERPFLAGTFVWTGLDYRGEPTPYTWPTIASLFGALDSCGFRKDAAYLFKAFWTDTPFVHVLPDMDQPVDTGTPVRFRIYTNQPTAELFLNGRSLGAKDVDPYDMAEWEVPYEMGTLRAVAGGLEDIRRTPGAMTGIRLSLSKQMLASDGEDAIAVNAEAVDAMGNFVPSADTMIFFETEGGGEIIGTGNGNPNSHEPDGLHYRRLFHGRCQAILRSTGAGDITIRAYAEDMSGDEEFVIEYEGEMVGEMPYNRD